MYTNHENVQTPSYYEYVAQDSQNSATLKTQIFESMKQLEGWCSEKKASILIDYILTVKPDKIVEIGVFGGKSLIPCAMALKANNRGKIYGIDPWDLNASIQGMLNTNNISWWSSINHENIRRGLLGKIDQFDLKNRVELIQTTSQNANPIQDIDILHLDGNHSSNFSYTDIIKWVPLVKVGGLILFNDMNWVENEVLTTAQAIEWLNTNCHKIAEFNQFGEDWGIWVKP